MTFQAEDEIAGIGAAIGAAYGGALAVTTTSGPGIALKSESIGLAVSLELPLIIVDVQRGGPSTGLPTKTEQSDLLQAMFGRNGESPVPVIAPQSPSDCFHAAMEAARIAVEYRTPVFLLSDGYLANGSEPWLVPDADTLPVIDPGFATGPNHEKADGTEEFWPYLRDPETLARPWAIPGTKGLEHRIGGLEKADGSGGISYDPENHDTDGPAAPGQGRRDRQDDPRPRRRRPERRRPRARPRAGARRTARSARPARSPAAPGCRSPRRTCATSTRSRATSARCCAPTTRCWSRR